MFLHVDGVFSGVKLRQFLGKGSFHGEYRSIFSVNAPVAVLCALLGFIVRSMLPP